MKGYIASDANGFVGKACLHCATPVAKRETVMVHERFGLYIDKERWLVFHADCVRVALAAAPQAPRADAKAIKDMRESLLRRRRALSHA